MILNSQRDPTLITVNPDGMVMGIDKGPIFNSSLDVKQVELRAGDLFTVFTHGVIEARNSSQEEFGVERMHHLVRRYGAHEAEYFCDKFNEYFDIYLGSAKHLTDVCVGALKVL